MRIVNLYAQNVKRIRCVDITPNPKAAVIPIAGRNGAGKTSVLDSIYMALAGRDAVPSEPVRVGEEKAVIKLNLGDVVVTRKFTEAGGTTLTVEGKDGAVYKSPQSMLDDLVGNLTFDPQEFARKKPREQLETLRGIVKIAVDIDKLDAEVAELFAARTAQNREVERLAAVVASETHSEDLPAREISVAGITREMQDAAAENTKLEQRKGRRNQAKAEVETLRNQAVGFRESADSLHSEAVRNRQANLREAESGLDSMKRRLETMKAEVKALESKIAMAEEDIKKTRLDAKSGEITVSESEANYRRQAEEADARAQELQKKLDAAEDLPKPIDLSEFEKRVKEATKLNDQIRARNQWNGKKEELAEAQKKADNLTRGIEARRDKKTAAIAAAKFPIEGLGFGENEVLYGGLPFSQASDAERLRVSVAIAMAMNPKLRILRIRDGSLLDDSNLKLIATMAKDNNYQVWMEVIESDNPSRVVMHDGRVKE